MYMLMRQKPTRCFKERHANFLVRSLSSAKTFEPTSRDIRFSSSLDDGSQSAGDNESNMDGHKTNLPMSNSFSLIPRELEIQKNPTSPLKFRRVSNQSQDAVLSFYRSTINSPTLHRTLLYSAPMNSCLGFSRAQYYQACSRIFFSSNSRKRIKIPTPKSSSQQSMLPFGSIDPAALARSGLDFTWSMTKTFVTFLVKLPGNTLYYSMNPAERKKKITEIKDFAKKEFDHYYMGSKLLMADVRTARSLLGKTLQGSTLTRRERKQLLRTVTDLFRLVPFSMFILIPFMEFALPFALKIFPNMLPSTFQDSLKSEENMKRELKSRIAMAQFFQETLVDLAKEQKRIAVKQNTEDSDDKVASKQVESAASLLEFLDRARNGEMMPPDIIVQYATYFQDDLTLDNMPRMQLLNMCKYMGMPAYGSDLFLRFQLRHRIKTLKEDDQRILWEGINSLTKMELREACQERGMRSTGLSKDAYKRSLQQWLDLSVNMNVPISLLIMSRTFFLQEESATPATSDEAKSVAGLADAISGLDKEVLNEVILEVATSEEKKSDPDVRKIKLEVLSHQNEKIREEQAQRDSVAAKKKESAEKAEAEKAEKASETPKDEADSVEGKPSKSQTKDIDTTTEKFFDDTDKKTEVTTPSQENETKEPSEEEKGDRDLSADEMEAIEQLVSADPVSKEREDLARIKSAIKESEEDEEEDSVAKDEATASKESSTVEKAKDVFLKADEYAKSEVKAAEQNAFEEAKKSTTFSSGSDTSEKIQTDDVVGQTSVELDQATDELEEEEEQEEEEEDVVVARLKKSIESMVDKIEVQLSDVQVKIGDKLHFLDKDMDGILTREEMVDCLQQVFKRNISFEEATEIASQMDENNDGVLTVQELIKWIEENKLVRLESEGRDADMDRIMEKRNQKEEIESQKEKKDAPQEQ